MSRGKNGAEESKKKNKKSCPTSYSLDLRLISFCTIVTLEEDNKMKEGKESKAKRGTKYW